MSRDDYITEIDMDTIEIKLLDAGVGYAIGKLGFQAALAKIRALLDEEKAK